MRFRIDDLERPGPELGSILQGLAQSSRDALQGFVEDSQESIHTLRTNMKKVRALLRLAAPELSQEGVRRVREPVRRLKDGYANARDEVVLERLLKQIATPLEASVLPRIFKASEIHPPPPGRDLFEAVDRLSEALADLPFWAVTAPGVHRAFEKACKKAAKARKRCGLLQMDQTFHHWRKCLKTVWYQASVLGETSRGKLAAGLAEELGHANDLANLRLRLTEVVLPEPLRIRIEHDLAQARQKALHRARRFS